MAKKLIGITIGMALSVLFFTGCVTKHTENEIEEFVRENCKITKFTVSSEPAEVTGEDGYTDKLWTVTTEEGLVFHVMDDYHWGMESLSNYLYTDYEDVYLTEYGKSYDFDKIRLCSETDGESMVSASLCGSFADREEFDSLFAELEQFLETFSADHQQISVSVEFQMDSELRDRLAHETNGDDYYVVDDGDYSRKISWDETLDCYDLKYEEALRQYIQVCADYRLENILADFTAEEIKEAVTASKARVGISETGGEEENYLYYEDICSSLFGYGISFGALYEILSREGYDVEGNSFHYSFIGEDSCQYEISYDFLDLFEYADGDTGYGYYYLKDQEVIPMSCYFYNHFTVNEVEKMTGLVLTTK